MRALTPVEHRELHELLVEAFPTLDELERLSRFGIGVPLEHAAVEQTLPDAVFALIEYALARGVLEALVREALRQRRGAEPLAAWARSVGVAPPPESEPPAGARGRAGRLGPRARVALLATGGALAALGVAAGAWWLLRTPTSEYFIQCSPATARVVRSTVDGRARAVCNTSVRLRPDAQLAIEAEGYEPFRGTPARLECNEPGRCTVYLRRSPWRFVSAGEPRPDTGAGELCSANMGAAEQGARSVLWEVRVRPPAAVTRRFKIWALVHPAFNDGRRVLIQPGQSDEPGCEAHHLGSSLTLVEMTPECAAPGRTLSLYVRACVRPGEPLPRVFELKVVATGGGENVATIEYSDEPTGAGRGGGADRNPREL